MKKILLTIIIFLFSVTAVKAASTLWEYYDNQGLSLPSVAERAKIASQANIIPYGGTLSQNEQLLAYLESNSANLGGSNPMTATDWQLSAAIGSTDTTIKVVSMNDVRGNTPVATDFSTTTYLVIDPNSSSNIEIVACPRSGITVATKTFTGCTRGLAFYGSSESAVTGNKKSHSAGSRVIQSNVGQFFNLFVDKWDTNVLYGNYTFASSTATKNKIYLGNSGFYIWADTATGGIGFSKSSNEFSWNDAGTTFSAIRPLVLSGGNLTLATSTNDFKLDGSSNLALNASSTGGIASNSNGVYVDGSDDFTWSGTNTFTGNLVGVLPLFGDGSDGNVTLTTGTTTLSRDMYYNNLTIPGDAELKTNGFRVYIKNTLSTSTATSGSGLITAKGGNGTNASGVTAGVAGTVPYTSGTLPSPVLSGISSNGQTYGGAGCTSAGAGTNSMYGFLAKAGGAGGSSSCAGGVAGATGTVVTVARNVYENYYYTYTTATSTLYPTGFLTQIYGINSSAGGGGGGNGGDGAGAYGGGGGGSGANGGLIWISARILNGVTIQAKAGNGGNGADGGGSPCPTTVHCRGGGGGGGGNGGVIILFYFSSSSITTSVTAGTFGTAGAGAGSGTAGTNGTAGQAGYVFNNDL